MAGLLNRLFAKRWQPFHTKDRDLAASTKVEAFADPGVYLFAYSSKPLEGRPVKPRDVFYVGMSNLAAACGNAFDNSNRRFKAATVTVNLSTRSTLRR
jgi:hypothetical protein